LTAKNRFEISLPPGAAILDIAQKGVMIIGLNVAEATDEELENIARIYRQKSLMVVRGQAALAPEQLVRFGKAFGDLEDHTRKQFTVPGYPTIYILSNKVVNGERIGVNRDGMGWHTDGSYLPVPLDTTVLYCIEKPPAGADTLIADTRLAFEDLPEAKREKLLQLKAIHSFIHLISRLEPEAQSVITEEQRLGTPDVIHPLVTQRPENGSLSIYVSNGSTREIIGMSEEESRILVDELLAHSTQDRFVYRHNWEVGDILIWNNRYTLHRATPYDDKKYERLVYRLWIKHGTAPESASVDAAA
jgi:taurine dioxygenase